MICGFLCGFLMSLVVTETTIQNILTRTSGFLRTVTSHSLQPYCGCSFGNALCGVGCYVQHNGRLLRGREWGSFLEVRTNAAESYLANYDCEARWARQPSQGDDGRDGLFSIFCSSSTDPFVPQEGRFGITRSVLEAMCRRPPDRLILQTHSHRVTDHIDLCRELAERCDLRIHVSIETDREQIDGLPPHASPVEKRLASCAKLKQSGLRTVVTVAPLLPIANPDRFFSQIADVADAVVIDHFIGGDGSTDGSRTRRTLLPAALRQIDPDSLDLSYRDRMTAVARTHLPGRVGINIDGFAGRYLP
jgi:DNA repair photolyase